MKWPTPVSHLLCIFDIRKSENLVILQNLPIHLHVPMHYQHAADFNTRAVHLDGFVIDVFRGEELSI